MKINLRAQTSILWKFSLIWKAGYRMPDAGYRMPDAGYRMQDAGCQMRDILHFTPDIQIRYRPFEAQ
jgi:hypothetical protein